MSKTMSFRRGGQRSKVSSMASLDSVDEAFLRGDDEEDEEGEDEGKEAAAAAEEAKADEDHRSAGSAEPAEPEAAAAPLASAEPDGDDDDSASLPPADANGRAGGRAGRAGGRAGGRARQAAQDEVLVAGYGGGLPLPREPTQEGRAFDEGRAVAFRTSSRIGEARGPPSRDAAPGRGRAGTGTAGAPSLVDRCFPAPSFEAARRGSLVHCWRPLACGGGLGVALVEASLTQMDADATVPGSAVPSAVRNACVAEAVARDLLAAADAAASGPGADPSAPLTGSAMRLATSAAGLLEAAGRRCAEAAAEALRYVPATGLDDEAAELARAGRARRAGPGRVESRGSAVDTMVTLHGRAAGSAALLTSFRLLQRAALLTTSFRFTPDEAVPPSLALALVGVSSTALERAVTACGVAAAVAAVACKDAPPEAAGPDVALMGSAAALCLSYARRRAAASLEADSSRAAIRLVEHPEQGPEFEPSGRGRRRGGAHRPLSAAILRGDREMSRARTLEGTMRRIDAGLCVALAVAAAVPSD